MHDLPGCHLDELDRLLGRPETLGRDPIRFSPGDTRTPHPLALAGIGTVVATAAVASIGEVDRLATPGKLARDVALTPAVPGTTATRMDPSIKRAQKGVFNAILVRMR